MQQGTLAVEAAVVVAVAAVEHTAVVGLGNLAVVAASSCASGFSTCPSWSSGMAHTVAAVAVDKYAILTCRPRQ